jgi:hypothetical protein
MNTSKLITVSLLNNIGNNCNDSDTFIVEFVGLVTKKWKHLDFYTPQLKNMDVGQNGRPRGPQMLV